MTCLTYQHNKKTGATYVYSAKSYWDKEKKVPRTRQVYLGKLDRETGEIIPSQRKKPRRTVPEAESDIKATARVAGPYLLLEKLAQESGLVTLLKRCFPEWYDAMLSLVYFIVQKGLPLSRSELWSDSHLHPLQESISSQRISELLTKITEDDRQRFLSLWLKKVSEDDYLCYDITSISSYAQGNEYVKWGYNRDGEPLPQVNLAMLFGQKSGLPAYYRRLPGNISDVATLLTTMKALNFLGTTKMSFVMDRGFYSEKNVDELLSRHHHFTMGVPSGSKWVECIIDRHYESVASPEHYHEIDDSEALYAAVTLHKWGEKKRRTYLHVYYNAVRAAEEFDRLTRKLVRLKKELESGSISATDKERYARYFIVKETSKRGRHVAFNEEEIQKNRKRYAGFFCILSNRFKDSMETLRVYRRKEVVENCFSDLKNQLDMKRLRIHSSAAMDSRIFLQFLALILICRIRDTIQGDKNLRNLTVREIMEAMESLVRVIYSGRYGQLYTEAGPLQRKIIATFGMTLPA
jgi:transposase